MTAFPTLWVESIAFHLICGSQSFCCLCDFVTCLLLSGQITRNGHDGYISEVKDKKMKVSAQENREISHIKEF